MYLLDNRYVRVKLYPAFEVNYIWFGVLEYQLASAAISKQAVKISIQLSAKLSPDF